jgi:uncharacterized membrane protein
MRPVCLRLLLVSLLFFGLARPALAAETGSGDPEDIVEAIRRVATVVLQVLVAASVALMAVGVAAGFLKGQYMVTLGQAIGLSEAWMRVATVIGLGLLGLLAMPIVALVVKALTGFVGRVLIPVVFVKGA